MPCPFKAENITSAEALRTELLEVLKYQEKTNVVSEGANVVLKVAGESGRSQTINLQDASSYSLVGYQNWTNTVG